MSALHDREPAILHPDKWEPYLAGRLDRDLTEPVGAGTLRLSKEDGFDDEIPTPVPTSRRPPTTPEN